MSPDITVLLSSYNGEKYIKEQIDSILQQNGVELRILIRDDGSTDKTVQIIESYQTKNISLIKGENVGSTRSFFELIKQAPESSFYAFSDQDDVWDPDKLSVAINHIKEFSSIPAIYSSNTRLVDCNLKPIAYESLNPRTTLGSALVKNYATGCTIAFNQNLMKFLRRSVDISVPYHDWWANLVALSVGGVSVYDTEPHISYRQHANNVVGATISKTQKWKSRLHRFYNSRYHREHMASELLRLYGEIISKENFDILKLLKQPYANKIEIIKSRDIKTGNRVDDLAFMMMLLVNRI